MNDDRLNALMLGLCLMLPLSALVARRMSISSVAKMAGGWIAIFAVGLLIASGSERIGAAWRDLTRSDGGNARGASVTIPMASDGHFWATAEINGVRRRMLIDSGATTTALSVATARAAKVDSDAAFAWIVETANGSVAVSPATVSRLAVSNIVVSDLPVVVSKSFGDSDVLGMNFLSQMACWRVEGRSLVPTPNHE